MPHINSKSHRDNENINMAMSMSDADMYNSVCPEEHDDCIQNEDLSETLPPCKECEKYYYYRKSTFNMFDALFVLISMGTFLADIVTDIVVTVQYFTSSTPQYHWGSLTLAFTLGPSIVMQIFSASWYVTDEDMTNWRWILHLCQLAPLQRYIRVFRTGLEAKKSDDPLDFQRLHHQQSDISMLRLFEAFLESAPQVVLQLYIIVGTDDKMYFTGISAVVSLFSLCWAMVAYSKNRHKVRNDKNIVSIPGLILQTIWRIGMISSRVVALVLMASVFPVYFFLVAALHWLCMTVWVYLQHTDFCNSWIEERIFNGVIGVIYIFCFFNLKEGISRYRISIYYAIMFAENIILLTLWYKFKETTSWYDPAGLSVVFGGFSIGVSSMLLYYRFFHPRGSGAISLFDKTKNEDKHRLHRDDHQQQDRSDNAEISRRSYTPTPQTSPHKNCNASLLGYSIATRSLTPCKYSPLKSDGKLPYDRYGMRRPHRSQSETCMNMYVDGMTTPPSRLSRNHSECLYSQDKSTQSDNFEFSGFATDLVKKFDKKMDQACESAMCHYSYGSYGFDVEAPQKRLQFDQSDTISEHKVLVHASSASQPDMRAMSVNDIDQSSVLLAPMPNSIDSQYKIKSAYEVQQIYHKMLGGERLKRTSKRQLLFGQPSSRSPSPIKNRTPSPMCPHHEHLTPQRSFSLPPTTQNAWQVSEIEKSASTRCQNAKKIFYRAPTPKVPLQADFVQNNTNVQNWVNIPQDTSKSEMANMTMQNSATQNRLKIPYDTSKAERAMLKCGEKRKFSFREKMPAASLKAMRFTPKMTPATCASSPNWKLQDLNARLWQPKTVDIFSPKVNPSGKAKIVAQQIFDTKSKCTRKPLQIPDSPNTFGNFYTIFEMSNQRETLNRVQNYIGPETSISNDATPDRNATTTKPSAEASSNFKFSISAALQSSQSNFNTKKTENIYATIDENGTVRDLGLHMPSVTSSSHSGFRGSSRGSGSGGKKQKVSPRSNLPQLELKPSQQLSHPVTPLTPSKSYRLADQDILNSPHRHLPSSNKSKARLHAATSKIKKASSQFDETLAELITPIDNKESSEVEINTKRKVSILKVNQKEALAIVVPQIMQHPSPKMKLEGKKSCKTSRDVPSTKTMACRSVLEKQSALSSSMPVIRDQQNRNASLNSGNIILKPETCKNDQSLLAKQSGKSQSLPEIPSSEEISQIKKGIKPKAHSDTRGNCKKSQASVVRKPLAQLQNGLTTSIQKLPSEYKKSSSNARLGFKLLIPCDIVGNTNISQIRPKSTSTENIAPLMQSTPAFPDCRKLLRFESTGAKPKIRQPNTNIKHGEKTKKKKPLSPVENNPDESQTMPVVPNSCKSRSGDITIATNPVYGIETGEGCLRDRIGRYDPDIMRSGKENQHHAALNQHLAVAKMFDVLSPTDSFISSLAFQNTFDRRVPPKKPPRMSNKIPVKNVADNVGNWTEL